jgi:protein TonB
VTLDDERDDARRWLGALAAVLVAHAAPLLVVAWWLGPILPTPPPEPAILIDMAPPAAPPLPPSEQPPGPRQVRAEAARPVTPDTPAPPVASAIQPEVALPEPRPEPTRHPAAVPAPQTSAPASRPTPPAASSSAGTADWHGQVLASLDKVKRYPAAAEIRRQQGVPYIRIAIDRQGRVLEARLERSSGISTLDREALELPRRAQPLPRPPADIAGERIELVVPVEFYLRR